VVVFEASVGASVGASVRAMSVSSAPFWVWWLVPVVVTLIVVGAVALARRERPRDRVDAVEEYARFRQAMSEVRDSTRRHE
jgi:cytochrome c-type biogenesis protein CcmH/NrfF